MRIGNVIILPWNRRNFIPRLIALGLVFAWLTWGAVIFYEGYQLKLKAQERQVQQQRREEQLRRAAAYQRRLLEEQSLRGGVQNAVDGFKR